MSNDTKKNQSAKASTGNKNTVKAKIESAASVVGEAAEAAYDSASKTQSAKVAKDVIRGVDEDFGQYARTHRATITYAFIGLVIGICVSVFGLWRTLVVLLFVAVGAIVGNIFDNHGKGDKNIFTNIFGD